MQISSPTQSSSGTRIARIGILPFPPLYSKPLHHIKRSSRVARLKGSRLSSVFEANLNSRKASARHLEIMVSRDEKHKVIEKVSLSRLISAHLPLSPNDRVILCWRDMRLCVSVCVCARNIIYQLLIGEMKLSRRLSPSPLHLIIPGNYSEAADAMATMPKDHVGGGGLQMEWSPNMYYTL